MYMKHTQRERDSGCMCMCVCEWLNDQERRKFEYKKRRDQIKRVQKTNKNKWKLMTSNFNE